jgi:hypothetical protein
VLNSVERVELWFTGEHSKYGRREKKKILLHVTWGWRDSLREFIARVRERQGQSWPWP